MNKFPTQKRLCKDGVKEFNEVLVKEFGSEFGGVLLGAYVTELEVENKKQMLSMIFGTTTGGRNDFLVKQKLDLIESIF